MNEGEYVIDHTYFLNRSETRTKRYHARTEAEARDKLDSLSSLSNTSEVLISKVGHRNRLDKIVKWQSPL